MCGRPDFGQRRRTLERLSAETNAAWEHACSYALLGRSIKNGPIAGQPPLFNPIKLTVRRRPTGSRNFSRPSTLTRFSAYRIARRTSGRHSASSYKLVGRASRGTRCRWRPASGCAGEKPLSTREPLRRPCDVLPAARLSHEGGKLQCYSGREHERGSYRRGSYGLRARILLRRILSSSIILISPLGLR